MNNKNINKDKNDTMTATPSTHVLEVLDDMKDIIHCCNYSGDTPYYVLDSHMERFTTSTFKDILNFRWLDARNCTAKERQLLYTPYYFSRAMEREAAKSGITLKQPVEDWSSSTGFVIHALPRGAKRNKNFISLHTRYVKSDYPSGRSAIYFMLSYLLVLIDYDFEVLERFTHVELLEPYTFLASLPPSDFVPFAKYLTALPFALYLEQVDLPQEPLGFPKERSFLFRGKIKQYLIRRCRTVSTKNTKLFWSILQGVKRACAVVPDSFVMDSLVKHAKILSTPSTLKDRLKPSIDGDWFDQSEAEDFFSNFKRKAINLARGFKLTMDKILAMPEASTSASLEVPLHLGGQRQAVLDIIHEDYLPTDIKYLQSDSDFISLQEIRISTDKVNNHFTTFSITTLDMAYNEEKDSLDWNVDPDTLERPPTFAIPALIKPDLLSMHYNNGTIHEITGSAIPAEAFRSLLKRTSDCHIQGVDPAFMVDFDDPMEAFLHPDTPLVDFHPEMLAAEVIPIREPLKVRNITKGQAANYYLAKPFQKASWQHMQTFPQLVLTGEPLTEDILHDLLKQEDELENKLKKSLDFVGWVSADYSSATDLIDIECTNASVDPKYKIILDSYPELNEYVNSLRKVLSPHVLLYSTDLKLKFDEAGIEYTVVSLDTGSGGLRLAVVMVNGQLMGSPTSFPELCNVNVIGYWMSLEEYTGMKIKARDLPCRANGDDILFRSNPEHYAIWKRIVRQLGFKLSVGKNYYHARLFTVNSVLYEFTTLNPETHKFQVEGTWRQVYNSHHFRVLHFFNPGLLTGQSKSTGRETGRKLPLGDLYSLVVPRAINPLQAHKWFLHYNREQIRLITDNGKFNLFIPRHLGGLGFPVTDEVRPYISVTTFQQRFATFLTIKIEEQFQLGIFPKKYLTAVVSDPLYRDLPNTFMVHHGSSSLETVPFGPLPEGWKEYELDIYTPPALTQQAVALKEIQYRLPSKTLLKEFNKFVPKDLDPSHQTTFPEIQLESRMRRSMPIERLLSNEKLRIASRPWDSPATDWKIPISRYVEKEAIQPPAVAPTYTADFNEMIYDLYNESDPAFAEPDYEVWYAALEHLTDEEFYGPV